MEQPNVHASDPCAALLALSKRYPFAVYGHIGKSLLGKEIPFLRVGEGDKNIVYIAGDVACDDVSEKLLLEFAGDLCACIEKDRTFFGICPSYLLRSRSLYILPRINPDGRALALFGADPTCPLYERQLRQNGRKEDFSAWQGNARGVVPGLNFNFNFAERRRAFSASTAAMPPMGEFPESENESARLSCALRTLTPLCLVQICRGQSALFSLGASQSLHVRLGGAPDAARPFPAGPGAWYHSQYRRPAIIFAEEKADRAAYFRIRSPLFEIIRIFCGEIVNNA